MGTVKAMDTATPAARATPLAGSGMDRPIAKPSRRRPLWAAALLLLALLVGALLWQQLQAGRSLTIAGDRIFVSEVQAGVFDDFIPLRARAAPLQTVYLDAIQGGRVEQVLVEDGAGVTAGQALLRLSNSDLQLSVMSTESRVMEQLNTMRDQELRLEQNRLEHKRTLVEVDYQIRRLGREIRRREELLRKGHTSESELQDLRDELAYYQARREVTLESQASDESLMAAQLAFFKDKTEVMESNLAFARQSLEELDVRAPVAGKLSGFDLMVGQNISRGQRLGQIDNAREFKLVADVDEFYLPRVDLGQRVSFNLAGREYGLRVSKIYPNVENGQFQVDMQFSGAAPGELRRGQTIQARLTLGDSAEALLIPNGNFFQDTGGRWLFVVSPDGTEALRREVRLGRRNKDHIEVLGGLDAGDRVITSAYSGFRDMDRLIMDND